MASAGKIYLDAELNTSNLQKQTTSLGKTIGKINLNPQMKELDKIVTQTVNGVKNVVQTFITTDKKVEMVNGKLKETVTITKSIVDTNKMIEKQQKQQLKEKEEEIKLLNKINDVYYKNRSNNFSGELQIEMSKQSSEYLQYLKKIEAQEKIVSEVRRKAINERFNLEKSTQEKINQIYAQNRKNSFNSDTQIAIIKQSKEYLQVLKQIEAQEKAIAETRRKANEDRIALEKSTQEKVNQIYANNMKNNFSGDLQIAMAKANTQTIPIANKTGENIALNLIHSISNTLASGSGGIIQGITALTSTIGSSIAMALGGPAAAAITTTVISILGNIAQMITNIVKGIVNTTIKIIKGGIQIIRKMFNFISELPSFIDKVVSKLSNMSITFKALGNVINYCKNLANQFMSIIGQKFSAYSIINFIEASLELGSSLTEQMHILEVVTPSFVAYNEALNGASQYSQYMSTVTSKLGISTINATKYLAGYGSMWKSLGMDSSESISQMSKDMLQLTSDIASFRDMDYEDVFKSLKSVIFGGQTRTGLNLGVDIYVDSMKEYAQSVGKVWDEMSGAEKSALRLEKVMEDLNFMYGDFEKTSYTWANQTRFLNEQLDNLKAVIGENLIMVFNNFLIILNKCLGALSTFSYAINNFLKSMGLGKVLESTGVNLSSALEDETGALNEAADSVGSAGSSAAKEIQRSLLGFDKLNNNLTKDSDSSSGSGVSSTLNDNLILDNNELKAFEEESETLLTKAITNLKDSLKKIGKFFNVLWEDFNTYFAHPFGEFLKGEDGIPRLINGVADLIDGIDWNKINVAFRRWFYSLEPLAEFFFNVGGDIQEHFINPLVTFWSNNILTGYIDTLTKFNNAVDWEKVRKGINNVLKALEPLIKVVMSSGLWIFQNILEPIGEWFLNSVWPILSDTISLTLETIISLFSALKPYWLEFFNEFLIPFAAQIGDNFISGLENFNTWLSTLKDNLNDETWVENNFGFISEDIEKLKSDLENFDIEAIVSDLFTLLANLISKADETFGISQKFKEMLEKVIIFAIDTVAPILVEKVQTLWSEYIKPKIKGWIDDIWEFVQPYVEDLGTWIVEKLVGFMVDMITLPATFSLQISKAIGDAFGKMFGDGSTEEQDAKSLGETIVTCIVDGFVNWFTSDSIISKIYNAIKGAFDSAVSKYSFNFSKSSNPNDTSSLWTNYADSSAASATSLIDTASVLGFANGGFIHSTPGGVIAKVAEAGDHEWLLPDKKLRKTIREESGNGYGSQIPIILQLSDGSELGSWLIDVISHEVKRTGKSIF